MEDEKQFKFLGIKLSNYWINFLFYFTICTLFVSLCAFVIGRDNNQFVPVRILYAMLCAKIFPVINLKR